MRIQVTKPLFAWDSLEDRPTLKTIKQLLKIIPDQKLLDGLQAARGEGRNDVPICVVWGGAGPERCLAISSDRGVLG